MTETEKVDAGRRQLREQTVLAHFEADNRQDVAATLATFKPGAARTELPGGEVADGPDAVAALEISRWAGWARDGRGAAVSVLILG